MSLAGLPPLHFRSRGTHHPDETVGRFVRKELEHIDYNSQGNMAINIFYEFMRGGVAVLDDLGCIIPKIYTDLYMVRTTGDNLRVLHFIPRQNENEPAQENRIME